MKKVIFKNKKYTTDKNNYLSFAKEIGLPLKKLVAIKKDGELFDLKSEIKDGDVVEFVTSESPEALEILRHSTAHLLAQAVLELFPEVEIGVGPAIENGFYYDFYKKEPFTPEDLQKIEKRMKELAKKNLEIVREELPKEKAIELFKRHNQNLKVELIQEKGGEIVSIYRQGDFFDFCRGPHLPSTGYIKHFKILHSSGAYWKGEEDNIQLQRIYGTAFFKKEELENYLNFLEEAKKRDHRRLGKELELFMISEDIGAGLIIWLPKGAFIRRKMEDFWIEKHFSAGYELLNTPHIANLSLWETSGHLSFYKENMFPPMEFENISYQLKPMNCPFHISVYKSKTRSYRDLPIRWAELGTVYRYERSGVLHGLLRVRGFTQDDAHIFCTPEQMEDEVEKVLDLNFDILKTFGFEEYKVYLSTRPEEYVGSLENWEKAELALKNTLEKKGIEYEIDPGEGVFYGPKIDIKIKDTLGRLWQCSTIQVDFNLPERFDISYIDENGDKKRPIMIHRALFGSFERFFGILIEHYAGKFPLWLSPTQVIIIPISEKQKEYALYVKDRLEKSGLRVKVDLRNEKMGYKIREAELHKIPYMLIVGDKEKESQTVSLRIQGTGDYGKLGIDEFVDYVIKKIENKELEYTFSKGGD